MPTYYISNDGDDSWDGLSISTPWKTISKVNGFSFSPGDSALFRCGDTFSGTLTISVSGTALLPIEIGKYGIGADPVISAVSLQCVNNNAKNYIHYGNLDLRTPGTRNFVSTNSTGIVAESLSATGGSYECFYINGGTATLTTCTATGSGIYGFNFLGAAVVTLNACVSQSGAGGFYIQGTANVTGYACIARHTTNAKSGYNGQGGTSVWYYCDAQDAAQDGFSTSLTASMTCWYCRSYDNAADSDGYSAHDTSTLNTLYCQAWGNGKSGAAHTGASSGVIYGCTFYNNYSAGSPATSFGIWLNSTGTWYVKNNIVKHHTYEIRVTGTAVVGGITLACDNNCYHNSRGGSAFSWNGTDYALFADYQAASGKDANSKNEDPLFRDAAGNDFSLLFGSPAADMGADLGDTYKLALSRLSVLPDSPVYLNQNNYGTAWDAGAFVQGDSPGYQLLLRRRPS